MRNLPLRYSMLIEWSEVDQAFLVTLLEWSDHVLMPATHGDTYTEAVQHGQEVLHMLLESTMQDGKAPPSLKTHVAAKI